MPPGRELAATGGIVEATAFSAIEQALWDLVGKALDAPVHQLTRRPAAPESARLREHLPSHPGTHARGLRGQRPRRRRRRFHRDQGRSFDGFPALDAPARRWPRPRTSASPASRRSARPSGREVDILIDCHSFFDVDLAVDVARRLEPQSLAWYEEPVAPTDVEATKAIERGIEQRMAGGEFLFGIEGFGPLCREQAVDVIMPDVKHCGGLLEARKIAAVAELDGVAVSPHNPSGPVATAASAQLCAGLPNFEILEMQWGEAAWRGDLVDPPERFEEGTIAVPEGRVSVSN